MITQFGIVISLILLALPSFGQDFSCGLIMGLGPSFKIIHLQNEQGKSLSAFTMARQSVRTTRQTAAQLADDLNVLIHRAGGQNAYATGVMKEMAGQLSVLANEDNKARTVGGWKKIIIDQGERLDIVTSQYQELLNFVCAVPVSPDQVKCWGYWPRQNQ